eukprot:TRINITY_DN9376_c0_g1_i1.p1 TRINITY_DN9376_c0_g1~~TRINITY_DN9376_c0_g1_i1.p1  ORF type:complete len:660 (+),score=291.76 TRINITY_DN9376_c0_g1_i1:67-1980(+)
MSAEKGGEAAAAGRAAASGWHAAVATAEAELRAADAAQLRAEQRVRDLAAALEQARVEAAELPRLRAELAQTALDTAVERAQVSTLEEGVARLRAACQELHSATRAAADGQLQAEAAERDAQAAACAAERRAAELAAAAEEKEAQLAAQRDALSKLRRIAQEVAAHNEVLSAEVGRLGHAVPALEEQRSELRCRMQQSDCSEEAQNRLLEEAERVAVLAEEVSRMRADRERLPQLQGERLVLAQACEEMAEEVPSLQQKVGALRHAAQELARLELQRTALREVVLRGDELRRRRGELRTALAAAPVLKEELAGLTTAAERLHQLRVDTKRAAERGATVPAQRALVRGLQQRLDGHRRRCQLLDATAAETAASHAEEVGRLCAELRDREEAAAEQESLRAAALAACAEPLRREAGALRDTLAERKEQLERRQHAHRAELQATADRLRQELEQLRRAAEGPRALAAAAEGAVADARERRRQEAAEAAARHGEELQRLEAELATVRRGAQQLRGEADVRRKERAADIRRTREALERLLQEEAGLEAELAAAAREEARLRHRVELAQSPAEQPGGELVEQAAGLRSALRALCGAPSPVPADPAAGAAADRRGTSPVQCDLRHLSPQRTSRRSRSPAWSGAG